jgi:hypothetical protein
MSSRCLILLFILASACLTHGADQAPDVLIVADVLAKDPAGLQPAPDKPVYYIFLGGMERDLGDSIGGLPSPDPVLLRAEISAALRKRGFIETKVGGPMPAIAIVYTWGHANLSTGDISETDAETGETTTTTFAYNSREIVQLVGINQARQHLLSSSEAQDLSEAARDDRLYLMVAALDASALRHRKKQLLWRTRMSIDARRHTLAETMGVMLASAAPYFAREESRPVFVDDTQRRKAKVKLGETRFLGEVPAPEVPQR